MNDIKVNHQEVQYIIETELLNAGRGIVVRRVGKAFSALQARQRREGAHATDANLATT